MLFVHCYLSSAIRDKLLTIGEQVELMVVQCACAFLVGPSINGPSGPKNVINFKSLITHELLEILYSY